MRFLDATRGYRRVLPRARRNRWDFFRPMIRRPALLAANGAYESALLVSNRVEPRLKMLGGMKAAARVGCEFCLDIGSALLRESGLSDEELLNLARFRESDVYDHRQKLVLELAEAITSTPATVSDDLRTRLDAEFTPAELAELSSAIAWENHRSRLNQALGVRPAGFSDGTTCLLPEQPLGAAR